MTDSRFDAEPFGSLLRIPPEQWSVERRRAGAIMMAQFGAFILLVIAIVVVAPDQIMASAPLSELGMGERTSVYFNTFLVAFGLMGIALGFFLARGGAGWFAAGAAIIGGLATIGAGFVHSEPNKSLHSIFAGAGFIGYSAMPFALAHMSSAGVRFFSYTIGILSLLLLSLWGVATINNTEEILGLARGPTQRWNLATLAVWTLVYGSSLAIRPAKHRLPSIES